MDRVDARMANKYYQIYIGELKGRPFHEDDELYRVWRHLVRDQFRGFDEKKYKTERGVSTALRRIQKYFPDIPFKVGSFSDI